MSAGADTSLDWAQRHRLLLLEARLLWYGQATVAELRDAFAISRSDAEADIAQYQAMAPDNLQYDVAGNCFRAAGQFEPILLRGNAQEFLQVLQNHRLSPELPLGIVAAGVASVEVLGPPHRDLDLRILQRVAAAIRERRWLRLHYQSSQRPEPRELEVAPHALGFVGRWHLRAYSRTHDAYRDLLLSRITEIPELLGGDAPAADEDFQWRNFVNVKIGAHPGLDNTQRRAVEMDYGMQNGVLQKSLRVAMVSHYLRLLRIGGNDVDRPPAEQAVVLLNRAELEAYLP